MIKKLKPRTSLTQKDAIAEAVSVESSHLVLDTSPPDYVVQISRYLESSVRQSRPNEDLPESDGDSGDSLFVTQKPVPEAVRSGRHSSFRSDLTFPTELEDEDEGEDGSLPSSHSRTKTKKKRRAAINLPKYDFPFLKEKPSKSDTKCNIGLHNCATAGFFECVRELWQSRQRGQVLQTSSPTMDIDGGCISPLSQDEETSEGEDIRVVERKRFVSSLKPKSSQPWYKRGKTDSQVKQHWKIKQPRDTTSHETSCNSPDMTSTPSALLPPEATGGSIGQTETPNTKRGRKRPLFSQKEKEKELCEDSDATLSDLSPEKYTPKRREASSAVTQPQADVFHTDLLSQTEQEECEPESQSLLQIDTNNDTMCSETGLQRRKKKKKHRENHQSTEEPAAQHAAASQNMEITEVEETLGVSQAADEPESHEKDWTKQSLHDDNMLRQEEVDFSERKQKKRRELSETEEVRQEAEADLRVEETLGMSQAVDEPESHRKDWTNQSLHDDNMLRQEEMDISERKQKKKKKKRKEQSETEEVQQEAEADLRVEEDSVSNTEIKCKKKKKKKRKRNEEEEQVELLKSDEPLNDDTDIYKNRAPNSDHMPTEQFGSPQESESSYVKRKKHKKKQQPVSNNDTQAEEDDCTDANVSNDGATLAERTSLSVTKKKKRIAERMNGSHAEESTTEGLVERGAELATKKKKKKKVSSVEDDDVVAQSDDSVSVWKKEKKRTSSFLVADAEQIAAHKHTEKCSASPSPSEAAHVWHAEKPAVSNGDFTTELAEMVVSLEESEEGVRKKKKKKHQETPHETLQIDLDEIQVKIKKKKKKDEPVLPPETSGAGCCQIDEDVASKKKKKKKKTDRQESAATEETLNTCNSAVDATVHDSSTCSEQVDKQMVELALETPEKQALNNVRDKKKKQVEDTFNEETAAQEHKKKKKKKLKVGSLLSEIPHE
ncbi:phoenix [Parambassis ranga]|uniref:Phoenix n=1 Tax=Parambassis ranga TaxID=210632 RepID=A0A6P7JJ36_9TELE|nr:trichohyalin-like [Parambassis ranga]